jgi:proline iminopeptidase
MAAQWRDGLRQVRDTRLFVADRGDPEAPALVYLHGGPGMGCHEFLAWQGDRLAAGLRLIAFDQRGVWSSDQAAADAPLDEDVLVEDCDALREVLGLGSWAVLGHSFGGRLALRYATRYPDQLSAVIFENPAWDIEATERFRLPELAAEYDRLGQPDLARRCREQAASPDLFAHGYQTELMSTLTEFGVYWHLKDQTRRTELDAATPERPADQDVATGAAARRLMDHPMLFESLLPLLGTLTRPALLITGAADLVCSPGQASSFRQDVPGGQAEVFADSAHFAQFEQPEKYAQLIQDFVTTHAS